MVGSALGAGIKLLGKLSPLRIGSDLEVCFKSRVENIYSLSCCIRAKARIVWISAKRARSSIG